MQTSYPWTKKEDGIAVETVAIFNKWQQHDIENVIAPFTKGSFSTRGYHDLGGRDAGSR